jgi:DNA-binding response OmpR family regulator
MCHWLRTKGHQCAFYSSAEAFKHAFANACFDIAILDWDFTSVSSGLDVLHWIHKKYGIKTPVIFVAARQDEGDIVTALASGADDYLAKPIRRNELLARLSVATRRVNCRHIGIRTFLPYTIDTVKRQILLNDTTIRLTAREFELANYLFLHHGKDVSRTELLSSVWGTSPELKTRTVDIHVSRVRKKLKLGESNHWNLTSVPQYGYRLDEMSTHQMDTLFSDRRAFG